MLLSGCNSGTSFVESEDVSKSATSDKNQEDVQNIYSKYLNGECGVKKVVKTSFNQRRKTIRNSLKPVLSQLPKLPDYIPYLDARPEQLSVEEFVELTLALQ